MHAWELRNVVACDSCHTGIIILTCWMGMERAEERRKKRCADLAPGDAGVDYGYVEDNYSFRQRKAEIPAGVCLEGCRTSQSNCGEQIVASNLCSLFPEAQPDKPQNISSRNDIAHVTIKSQLKGGEGGGGGQK